MKQSFYALVLLAALGACRDRAVTPDPTGLVGRWQLVARQCYCPAGPVPDEAITFDANRGFRFFRDGKQVNEGTYDTSVGSVCSGAPSQPLLTFSGLSSSSSIGPGSGSYTLQGKTLVIDQGTHCLADVPVSTYEWRP